MHLSLPFVLAALFAWQVNASVFYGKADISHDRVGAAHRMILRARGTIPDDPAAEPVGELPQEGEKADPAIDNLMTRLRGNVRPLDKAAFEGNLVEPEATNDTQAIESEPDEDTNTEAPSTPAGEGEVQANSDAILEAADEVEEAAEAAPERRAVKTTSVKTSPTPVKAAAVKAASTPATVSKEQKVANVVISTLNPALVATPAVKLISTPQAAAKPATSAQANVKAESKVQPAPAQDPTTTYKKPAAPSGFTGVDLLGGRTPTFVPNPPTFGARPPFKRDVTADAVPVASASGVDAAKVKLEDAIEYYLAETNTTLEELASELEQTAANSQNATFSLDSAPVPVVGAVDLSASGDLDQPEGEINEKPPPVALGPAEGGSPAGLEEPAAANGDDPLGLLQPTPTFVPNPPTFEKRRKRRAF